MLINVDYKLNKYKYLLNSNHKELANISIIHRIILKEKEREKNKDNLLKKFSIVIIDNSSDGRSRKMLRKSSFINNTNV